MARGAGGAAARQKRLTCQGLFSMTLGMRADKSERLGVAADGPRMGESSYRSFANLSLRMAAIDAKASAAAAVNPAVTPSCG